MPEQYSKVEEIYNDVHLNKLIDDLLFNQIYEGKFELQGIDVNYEDLRKGIWLISILANSNIPKHKIKAQLAASLIYLQNSDNVDIERACYVLFSRIGNLTGTRLFPNSSSNWNQVSLQNHEFIDSFDSSMLLELELERGNKSLLIVNEIVLTTLFQKQLWLKLISTQRLIISAPTSSGKSFIVKKFIKEKLSKNGSYYVLYIVPSRALLNQVSEELRNEVDLKGVDIKTVFIPNDDESLSRKVFILTPERCLRLLKERWLNKFHIDFIFIDEVQNVEDTQGRGSLFEFVFKELMTLFEDSKIVVAGPNIEESADLYKRIFGVTGEEVQTLVSPVFQIKTVVTPLEDRQFLFTLQKTHQTTQSFKIQFPVDLKRTFAKSTGNGLRELINLCGKGDQNIIYSPKGNLAEIWALKFIENIEESDLDAQISEIVNFLEDEIHPSYNLITCLKKGVAFHHGNLPDIVRKEIEDCFLDGKIKNLFCTSTLLQGVNLPANNIFIVSARKKHFPLSSFDFGNLIGRAGRIKDTLYGTTYCIERSEENQWSPSLYESSPLKEVQTASDKALDSYDDFIKELTKNSHEIESDSDANSVVFYRQKYLQDQDGFLEYLTQKGLAFDECNAIIGLLRTSVESLTIPHHILKLNPTIDPILQDSLYVQIIESGVDSWLIPSVSDNPNFYKYISQEEKDKLLFKNWSFYLQFNDLIRRLDAIFFLSREAFYKHNISLSIGQICYYAKDWIKNKSFSEMINADIEFYSKHRDITRRIDKTSFEDVNKRINSVIKINSVVTTHIVVKYIKLMNDIIENIVNVDVLEKYKFSLALPIMFELGTTEPVVISLISKGVSRSIALKIFSEFKKVPGYQDTDIFSWLSSKTELKVKPLYNRYLRRMKLLKNTTDTVA